MNATPNTRWVVMLISGKAGPADRPSTPVMRFFDWEGAATDRDAAIRAAAEAYEEQYNEAPEIASVEAHPA